MGTTSVDNSDEPPDRHRSVRDPGPAAGRLRPVSGPDAAKQQWGVPPVVPVVVAVLAAAAVGWAVTAGPAEDRVVAAAASVLLLVAAVAAARFTRRLRADAEGFRVRTLTGERSYSWSDVTALTASGRARGARRRGGASVDIDLAGDALIVLGRWELGADPVEVAQALTPWWRAATGRQ